MDTTYEPRAVNVVALHETLATALGDIFAGISSGPDGLRVHWSDAPTEDALAAAEALIDAHDPTALTPDQQQRADQEATLTALAAQVQVLDLSQPLSAEDADVVARFNALRGVLGR